MMLLIYNLVLLILLPIMVTRITIKGFKDRDYLSNLSNRFGLYKGSSKRNLIWFHAVSLGEVIGSEQLLKKFIENHEIILTVSTPTGLRHAKDLYGDRVMIAYAPWDFYIFVNFFFKKFNPTCLILFETEIWPSMISIASKRKVPIILSNARLSESSLKRYLLLKPFSRNIIKRISIVLAQSKQHVERFIQIGVLKENIKQVGSIKFDAILKNTILSSKIVNENKYLLAASTHEGEEEIVIDSYCELLKDFQNLKLVIVPRHPERADSVMKILKKRKLLTKITSHLDINNVNADVIVINATGKLNILYELAEIAFIGGSLFKKYGGHNLIEPANNKCAIILGPYMKNFEDIVTIFNNQNACIQLQSQNELSNAFKELLNNDEYRINMIDNASKAVAKNRGSSEIQYKYINDFIKDETYNSNNKTF